MPDQAQEQTPVPQKLEVPEWRTWRERGCCMLWQSAMLTLNLNPSTKMISDLKNDAPETYKEYIHRRNVLNRQYGIHTLLPKMDHPLATEKISGRYVALINVLEFALAYKWKHIECMEEGLSVAGAQLVNTIHTHINPNFDNLPKGEKYGLIRMCALLKIFEKYLKSTDKADGKDLLHGDDFKLSELGDKMEKYIGEVSIQQRMVPPYGFKKDTNRKALSDAQAYWNEIFGSKK